MTRNQEMASFLQPFQYLYLYVKRYRLISAIAESLDPYYCNQIIKQFLSNLGLNKPAAQAAGADPSRCNSTNSQNPPFQQNRCNF